MRKLDVLDQSGKKSGELRLPDEVFAYPAKGHLLYEAVTSLRANQRQGTAATKTRGETRGGGRKPWRQKGTGRARVGSTRSPLWRKGGTVFGPQPRDYSFDIPKKAKRNALRSALSQKYSDKEIIVLKAFELPGPKTREAATLLKALGLDSALLVEGRDNTNLFLSIRNIPKVKAVDPAELNVVDVLSHKWLVFSHRSFDTVMERLK